jgi:hypothetical protein
MDTVAMLRSLPVQRMDLAACTALVEQVLSRPYPSLDVELFLDGGAMDRSGPAYHIVTVAVSEVLVYATAERWAEVEDDFGARRALVVSALATLWGSPRRYDFGREIDRLVGGEEVQQPVATIAMFLPDVDFWQHDGRMICVGVGQWDKEFPMQLVLVVGELHLE